MMDDDVDMNCKCFYKCICFVKSWKQSNQKQLKAVR